MHVHVYLIQIAPDLVSNQQILAEIQRNKLSRISYTKRKPNANHDALIEFSIDIDSELHIESL
jgi:hypothetical protein